ncbi:MAG TPA: NADH-quinone oxidoreductase subunit NuoG [Armatimonadota bacterium]|nr:NADH-quinone oxidoreductase subunit NuoG [Armatimonadota bacterium]
MPRVTIDGTEYSVGEGKNMLQVALDNKLDLEYFCWHPAMGSVGACRICAVRVFKDENDTKGKIEMACMTPAREGTRISIKDPEAVEFRRYVIEWLMTNHPHDCPVCDEGGECHLQDMTAMSGHVYRRFRGRKRTYRNQDLGPFVTHEMNRCIQCYRCVRFYVDYAGGHDFDAFGSKNRVYFGRAEDGVLESEFSGNLVEVCPTGVFTDKTLKKHYTRKWDLENAPSVCIHCSLGCNTIPGARYGELRRIRARYNREVNGYFLCDRGRYGYEFVNHERRIRECRINGEKASWDEAIARAKEMLSGKVFGIGSPRASLEANYALKKLVGDENFSTGLSAFDQAGVSLALDILRNGPARTPSLAEVESADAILILGADPTNEAPMLDLAIRQAMRNSVLDVSRKLKIPDWDAQAVNTAVQGHQGILLIKTPFGIKLGELAGEGDLKQAAHPLIVTSISAGMDVLKSAANLVQELHDAGKDCMLTIIVPEANTVGVGMLGGMSVEDALSREVDTIIVLENDLTRRIDNLPDRKIIALDCIETPVTSKASVVLPINAYVESDGTFVNNEGRAQRFYQVFVPCGDIRHSWEAIRDLAGAESHTYEDVLKALAAEMSEFAPALEASFGEDWRSPAGQKIARQPHRFSGRTAVNANIDVNEPRPPDDPQTPFAFTMEGYQNPPPGPLIQRFWWPGWNSDNSVTKFQIEVNGPLHDENPGKRLIEPSGGRLSFEIEPPQEGIRIIPRPMIFGSEELSRLAPGIAQLTPPADIAMNSQTAKKLGLAEGGMVEFAGRRLPLRLDESVYEGIALIPKDFEETKGITGPFAADLRRAEP